MKKFFDVKNEKYLDFEEKDIVKKDKDIIKIKNKYFNVILNDLEKTYYVFDVFNNKKEAEKYEINKLNKYFIKCAFDNVYYHDTYNVRKNNSFPTTYTLNIGDKCLFGNLTNCSIIDKDERGYYYIKYYPSELEIKKNPEIENNFDYSVKHWSQVFPYVENAETIEFEKNEIIYYNMCIDNIISKYFKFGIDLNPEYQRESVWTEEQKVLLIDSIYKSINIGAFVLVEKKWFNNNDVISEMYEILDGKQRLTAIIDYISSKFKYKGKYYHELSSKSRNEFENQPIMIGTLKLDRNDFSYNRKKIINQFIRLNECGTTMKKSVIDKAKELIKEG